MLDERYKRMFPAIKLVATLVVLAVFAIYYFTDDRKAPRLPDGMPDLPGQTAPAKGVSPNAPAERIPPKVMEVLKYVDEHDEAPPEHQGGRHFGNFERLLPSKDKNGKTIKYREWDVNPLRPGVSRGAERLVTGSDGSAHYTADHYASFKRIR